MELTVLGVAAGTFFITHLGQGNGDDIGSLIAGIGMGIFISGVDMHRRRQDAHQQQDR